MNKVVLYISFIAVFSSCEFFPNKNSVKERKSSSNAIAKVYEHTLYQEDLVQLFPSNIASKDSVEVAKGLIDSWAKKKMLLKKAEVNMPSTNLELEQLVERYREDLFINTFKKALVLKELDTVVTNAELESYYEENKESFKVNEELVKFKFIAIKPNNKKRNKYKKLLLSDKKKDLIVLYEDIDLMESSFLNDSTWVRYKDVQRKLPLLKKTNYLSDLKPNKFIANRFDGNLYYIHIKDVINRNEIAPLRYISNTIRQMVLQQRKLQLINKVESVLLDDAIKNKQFEIY